MKGKIFKIIVFIIVFFLLDRGIALIVSKAIIKSQYDKRLLKILENEVRPDCYIMGSSSAVHGIIASEIKTAEDKSYFNIAYQGTNIEMQVALLKIILKQEKKPERIIYVANDSRDITEIEGIGFRPGSLYPLITYSEVNNIICDRGEKNLFISYLSRCYRQNVNFTRAINYILFGTISPDSFLLPKILDDGSMPIDSIHPGFIATSYIDSRRKHSIENESAVLRDSFLEYKNLCERNNIELVIVFPPNYFKVTDNWVDRIKDVGGDYPIYIDLSAEKWNKKFYYDDRHFNRAGAMKFSRIIGERIRDRKFN